MPVKSGAMDQALVRVGLYIFPPIVEECAVKDLAGETPLCPYPGLVSKFLAMCLSFAQLNYTIVSASPSLGSLDQNTTKWTGLFGQLQRGDIDVIGMSASFSMNRAQYFAYTRFFLESRYVFLIKMSDVRPSQGALLLMNGFAPEVWLGVLVTLMVIVVTSVVRKLVSQTGLDPDQTCCGRVVNVCLDRVWDVTRFILLQCHGHREKRRYHLTSNILILCLSILAVVLINVYQNVVYNQISSTAKSPPFRSAEELVDLIRKGQLTLVTHSYDVIYFDYVNTSEHGHFPLMKRALAKNPAQLAPGTSEAIQMLESGQGYVYVTNRLQAKQLVANSCDIAIVDLDTTVFRGGLIMNKQKHDLLRRMDQAIAAVSGRVDLLEKQTEARYSKKCVTGRVHPLPLGTMVGVFMAYCIAAGLALMIGMGERVAGRV